MGGFHKLDAAPPLTTEQFLSEQESSFHRWLGGRSRETAPDATEQQVTNRRFEMGFGNFSTWGMQSWNQEMLQHSAEQIKQIQEDRIERAFNRFRPMPKAMTAVTWLLILALGLTWLVSMACLTLVTAQQIYQQLYEVSGQFIRSVSPAGSVERFYDEAQQSDLYGSEFKRPDILDHNMLDAIAHNNSGSVSSTQYLEKPVLLRHISYPMQTAVLFYDGEGNLLHKSGDFLYFYYVTQEQWDAGEEDGRESYGWIDLSGAKGTDDDPYARFRVAYSGTRSLWDYRVLRVTGVFEGTELKPAAMDFLTETMLEQALEQLEPAEHYFDESGTETITYDYLISDLDRAGLLEWQTQFDFRDKAEDPEALVMIYALHPEMSMYEEKPVFYNIWRRSFESLAALTEELDFPSWAGVFENSGGFLGMSEHSLDHILRFSGVAYRDWSSYHYTADDPLPKADFYVVTAIYSRPLRCAFAVLRNVYILTALLTLALLLFVRGRIKRRLVKPLQEVNHAQGSGWGFVYRPNRDAPPMWEEAETLLRHHGDEINERQFSKNKITQLQTALDYAKTAEENRRQMVSAVAHELKTPLAVVHAHAEGLQEHIAEDKREQYVGTILSETERMDALVLEMLDLSRLEAGRVTLSRDAFSLSALALSVFEKLRPLAEEKGLTLDLEPEGECPVLADEGRIGQVIENFASNAVRYAPAGGTITVKTAQTEKETLFSVENTTERPFTQEELNKVWETFYRTDKARSGKGTGLGLAIAKNIVELHRGRVSVRNTDGGVAFSFTLPA